MNTFMKKIIDWSLEKENDLAKKCAVPMEEIEYQIKKVQQQKEKVQKEYDDAMQELDDVLQKLEKIKSTETLRCQSNAQ